MNNFNEEFHNDWGLPEESTNLKKNKNINKPSSIENNEWGNSENEYINTFLGKFPKNIPEYELGTEQNKEMQKEMLNSAAFSPGIKLLSGGLSKLPEMAKTLLTKSEPKKLVQSVQKGHDLLDKESSGIYDLIKNTAKSKNLKVNIDNDLIDYAATHLPKTSKIKSLLSRVKEGDYDAIHNLQSSLGKLGSQNITQPMTMNAGHEMLDARNLINESIKSNFIKSGESDLAHLLEKGRTIFKNKMDTYYEHPGIARMVRPNLRKIPKNIQNFFSEESVPMSNIINKHPEIKNELDLLKSKDDIINNLKKAGYIGLPSVTTLGGASYLLRNLLSPTMSGSNGNNYGNK